MDIEMEEFKIKDLEIEDIKLKDLFVKIKDIDMEDADMEEVEIVEQEMLPKVVAINVTYEDMDIEMEDEFCEDMLIVSLGSGEIYSVGQHWHWVLGFQCVMAKHLREYKHWVALKHLRVYKHWALANKWLLG